MPIDQDNQETAQCYSPICDEELSSVPDEDVEGYCSWECAVMARNGTAARIDQGGDL